MNEYLLNLGLFANRNHDISCMSVLIYWKFLLNISWGMSAQLQVSLDWPGCFWFLRNTNLFKIERRIFLYESTMSRWIKGQILYLFLIWILSKWWSHGDVTCITTITIHVLFTFSKRKRKGQKKYQLLGGIVSLWTDVPKGT